MLVVALVFGELHLTFATEEVLLVERLVQRRDAALSLGDRLRTVGTFRREQVVIVLLAVALAVALEERTFAQLLSTVRAHEMFWVVLSAQRCDHLTDDRLSTAKAAALRQRLQALLVHLDLDAADDVLKVVDVFDLLRRGRCGALRDDLLLAGRTDRSLIVDRRLSTLDDRRVLRIAADLSVGVRELSAGLHVSCVIVHLEVVQGRHQVVQFVGGIRGTRLLSARLLSALLQSTLLLSALLLSARLMLSALLQPTRLLQSTHLLLSASLLSARLLTAIRLWCRTGVLRPVGLT